jgi:hypothetical protein
VLAVHWLALVETVAVLAAALESAVAARRGREGFVERLALRLCERVRATGARRQAANPKLPLPDPVLRERALRLTVPAGVALAVPAALVAGALAGQAWILAFIVVHWAAIGPSAALCAVFAVWRGWIRLDDGGGGGGDDAPEPVPGGPCARAHEFRLSG